MAPLRLGWIPAIAFACVVTPRPQAAPVVPTLDGAPPIVIAHRGASGELPEHTIAAYERAIEQGADFIEPDLVMTRDGVLIARHDRYLSTTTDVAARSEFASRRREGQVGEKTVENWWAEDFTLAEIRTLRAVQPFAGRPDAYDGRFEVPTFDQVLELVAAQAAKGRTVGVYPETKAPAHHAAIGLPMAAPLLDALERAELREKGIPVFIQSFEPGILRSLRPRTSWPLVQLIARLPTPGLPALDELDVNGLGINKALLWNEDGSRTDLVERAHARGLVVHVWTLRDDRVAPGFADAREELAAVYAQGVDGVFADFPDTALDVRDAR